MIRSKRCYLLMGFLLIAGVCPGSPIVTGTVSNNAGTFTYSYELSIPAGDPFGASALFLLDTASAVESTLPPPSGWAVVVDTDFSNAVIFTTDTPLLPGMSIAGLSFTSSLPPSMIDWLTFDDLGNMATGSATGPGTSATPEPTPAALLLSVALALLFRHVRRSHFFFRHST